MVDNVFNSVSRVCSTIAAFWALALAFLILYDITGRTFFNTPFDGTIEIVANSMVSILFLQLPYTIYRGAHLRTAVIYQNLGDYGQRAIDVLVEKRDELRQAQQSASVDFDWLTGRLAAILGLSDVVALDDKL